MNKMDLFRLHKEGDKHKLELILSPLMDNKIIDITENEFNKIDLKYNYFKGENNTFVDNLNDDSYLHYALRLEYRKDFKKYYACS